MYGLASHTLLTKPLTDAREDWADGAIERAAPQDSFFVTLLSILSTALFLFDLTDVCESSVSVQPTFVISS